MAAMTCCHCGRRRGGLAKAFDGRWMCPPDDETCIEIVAGLDYRKRVVENADLNPHLNHDRLPETLAAIDRHLERLRA